MNSFGLGSSLAIAGLLFLLGRQDVKYRRVRNGSVLCYLFFCLLAARQFGYFTGLNLGCWLLSSAILYLFTCLRLIGAGDFKVIVASALYGFTVWGLFFFLAFAYLLLLDWMAYPLYKKPGSVGAPLLWLWAWSFFNTILSGLLFS